MSDILFRAPKPSDATSIRDLVREAGGRLEENSLYAYLLLCSHFGETGVVAEDEGDVLGFVVGYRPPPRPDTLFVWQVGVAGAARGRGLGKRLLQAVVDRNRDEGVRYLEATVTPSNEASERLFRAFARDVGADLRRASAFTAEDFGTDPHEEEILFRIGPWE